MRIHRKVQQPLPGPSFVPYPGSGIAPLLPRPGGLNLARLWGTDSHRPSHPFCTPQASAEEASRGFPKVLGQTTSSQSSFLFLLKCFTLSMPTSWIPEGHHTWPQTTEASRPSALGLDEPEVEKMGGGGQVPVPQGLCACLQAWRHHLVLMQLVSANEHRLVSPGP